MLVARHSTRSPKGPSLGRWGRSRDASRAPRPLQLCRAAARELQKLTCDPTHPHQATRIGDKLYQYDPDGNLTTSCRADAKHPSSCQGNSDHLRRLYWDDADRLSAVVDTQGRRVTRFVYDAGGNRVIKEGHLGTSITVGPYFNLRRNRLASVHVMVGAR